MTFSHITVTEQMVIKAKLKSMLKKFSQSESFVYALTGVVLFGSIWGFLEATLGGFLHLIHFSHKGAIMGGVGMSIMATFVATHRRPSLLIGVGFIAALSKPLSALIYGQPVFAPFVVNPATAILLEALAFSLVAALFLKAFERSVQVRIAAGVAAGYLSITLYAIVASVAGMGKWPSMGLNEKFDSVFSNGTGIAIAGTVLLLLGYMAGRRLQPKLLELKSIKPKIFYSSAAATAVSCWIIAAFAFASGL